jgi:predicted nucleic acid-binding protein
VSGNNILLDTNGVLAFLEGHNQVVSVCSDKFVAISFITELELLGYRDITKEQHSLITKFLKLTSIIDINDGIKKATILLRSKYQIKLPDAIIAGTAINSKIPLLTSDKGFSQISDCDIIFFEPS